LIQPVAARATVPPDCFTALPCRRGGSPRIGKRWVSTFAGVLLVEAAKQIYAKPAAVRAPRRRLVYALAPHGL